MQKINNGFFIVIDGIDGSGKSTQCKMLYQYLLKNEYLCALVIQPDMYIILDLKSDIAMQRKYGMEIELEKFENLQFQKKIRNRFLKLSIDFSFDIVESGYLNSLELFHDYILPLVLDNMYSKGYIEKK